MVYRLPREAVASPPLLFCVPGRVRRERIDPARVAAERGKFEDLRILLPPLEPVSGFEGTATSTRVTTASTTAGDEIVTILALSPALTDDEQLEVERRIAQSAVEQLATA